MLEQVFSFGCEGVNGYGLMLQQLYNMNICWEFMDKSLPFHMLKFHDVGFVLQRPIRNLNNIPPSPHMMNIPKLYSLHTEDFYRRGHQFSRRTFVVLTSVWSNAGVAPRDAFFPRTNWIFLAPLNPCLQTRFIYSPLLHMVHLHHGHIPNRHTFFEHKVWRSICRLRFYAARSVLLPRVLHREDIVDLILTKCFSELFRV
jgi:hypothetical protein